MGMEKQGSKSFFQMFDWNSKSRKKLFSTKSDLPEQSKHKKICGRSLPTTQLHLLDEDGSSIKGSSDYSRASSVTDDDSCGTKAPNVVARLMGLDTMPISNFSDSYSSSSSPFLESQSRCDARYNPKLVERSQDGHGELASFKNFMVQNQKPINRPMEKFQTEVLPPKSAKSIPITHHKLLSPIKSANFVPSRDAAYVMEAAARIIERGPQATGKPKLLPVGSSSSSSVPLRVKNFKEKVQASQSSPKSSEECSTVIKNKGKSISLALQAKANVQKREGLSSVGHSTFNSSKSSKTTPKITTHKKPSTTHSGSTVLRTNNQKQNCANCDGRKLQDGKVVGREPSSVRQRTSTKASGNSKFGTRQRTQSSDDKREASFSSSERVTRKKRSVDGNYHQNDQKNQKTITSNAFIDRQSRWDEDIKSNGTDVVSFTFTTPMRDSTRETTRENCNDVSENYRTKRMLLSSDGMNKFSITGNSVSGGDALSTLLEQKFKELTCGLDFSDNKVPPISSSSSMFQDTLRSSEVGIKTDGVTCRGGSRFSLISECGNRIENKMLLDYRLPSPVSVLDQSSVTESLNSLETAESSTICKNLKNAGIDTNDVIGLGGSRFSLSNESADFNSPDTAASSTLGIKQCSSNQAEEVLGKCSSWELEYVKEILCNIETMFKDYALGRAGEIINPRLFDQLESRKWRFNGYGLEAKIAREALFDCVSECLDLRCKHFVSGGRKSWTKGLSVVRRKDRLAEEVYNEILSWSYLGDSMVDEFVDKDMSGKYGRWVEFDIEAFELGKLIEDRILSSLLDEVVDDILVL